MKLTQEEELAQLNAKGFEVLKYLFLNINRKDHSIYITSILKNSKETPTYKVKTPLPNLKFYDKLLHLIYGTPDP